MDITVPIPRKNTINVAIPEKNTITVDIVRKNTLSVQIDTPAIPIPPAFVSAEVGLIDAYTLDILFDRALNESKIPDNVDLIATFSGGATQIYDITLSGLHAYAKTGVNDWFLPSQYEMYYMAVNLYQQGIGGLVGSVYKTSSEYDATSNWQIDTRTPGFSNAGNKSQTNYYRSCRTFTSSTIYALRDVGPAGGWIFYITDNGNGTYTYLEAYPSGNNQSVWSNITNILIGTTSTAIGTGQTNSTAIINQVGHTTSAAKLADDLIIGRAITAGETGTIQYVPNALVAKQLQGLTGAKVAAFTESVTNNITANLPVIVPPFLIEDAAPTKIKMPYDLALNESSIPATTTYTLSSGRTATLVEVIGQYVYVTASSRYYQGDLETIAYTKPGTNMIKSTSGGEAASFGATAVTNSVAQLAFQNANTLMWLLSEDLSTITKDGSNLVSRWNDRQASGRDLIQATGTNQPLWSADGVLFDGVDNFMASGTFTFNQPEMIYIVMKQVTWTLNDQFWDGFAALSGAVVQTAATPNIRLWAGQFQVANTNLAVNTFGIIRALTNGTGSTLQVNTTTASTGTAGVNNMAGFTLARRSGSIFYGNIQVKEVIIRNTADDSTVQSAIYSYLSTKYGI